MRICLDGPAGSGKSTISRMVAEKAGFVHLDTGAIYRGLAWLSDREGVSWDDEPGLAKLAANMELEFFSNEGLPSVRVAGEDVTHAIRTPRMGEGASRVSRHPAVREALLELQRAVGRKGSLVAEGRDVGTVVFPDAELKIYLDASVEERARRRLKDYEAAGERTTLEDVMAAIRERDARDSGRAAAPLKAAEDAIRLDTTGLSPDEVVDRILTLMESRRESSIV